MKAIFFDFDGVLTTDENGKTAIMRNFRYALPEVDSEKIEQCFLERNNENKIGKFHFYEGWEEFCAGLGIDRSIEMLEDVWAVIQSNTAMFDLVRELKGAGYKTGIITSNSTERMEALTKRLQLDEWFDAVVCSGDVGSTKSSEPIFERALSLVDISAEESIFIDNHESNLVVPKEMGFVTYYFDHTTNDVPALRAWLIEQGITL